MAMAAPYWGNLDAPVINRQNSTRRRTSDGEQFQSELPPQGRVNRISVQSQAPTVSTNSPFVSPVASSFRADGLAPRPPSFPYGGGDDRDRDFTEKRRRRASRDGEQYYDNDVGPPPAVPAAPRPAPPVSYRQPYYNGASATYQASGRPPQPADSESTDYYRRQPLQKIDTGTNLEKRTQNSTSDYERERVPVSNRGQPLEEGGQSSGIRRGSVTARRVPELHEPAAQSRSRTTLTKNSDTKRREWAPDRSPLQRLELTLDSITKEEKRARVEEAELVAREAKAGRGGERANRNSVHFKNRGSASGAPEGGAQTASPQTLAEAGLVRSLSNKQQGELERTRLVESTKPERIDSSQSNSLGRGFDYQPREELQLDNPTNNGPNDGAPKRGLSFRERAAAPFVGAATGVAAGAALGRSGSNKLRKDPPGDPWFNKRNEAERNFKEVVPRRESIEARRDMSAAGGPLTSAPVEGYVRKSSSGNRSGLSDSQQVNVAAEEPEFVSDEDIYPSRPVRRNPMSKIAQLTGQTIAAVGVKNSAPQGERQPAAPSSRAEKFPQHKDGTMMYNTGDQINTENENKYTVAPDAPAGNFGQQVVVNPPDSHHHFNNILHHHREHYRPGDGLYSPAPGLSDWKKATVGSLTGAILDLEAKESSAEKNKAWWEAEKSSKRRSSTSRRAKIDSHDGAREDTNGMVFPSSLEVASESFIRTSGTKRRWHIVPEPVVLRARSSIALGATSTGQVSEKGRNGPWRTSFRRPFSRKGALLHQHAGGGNVSSSTFSSDCPFIYKHNIFHPFHSCPIATSQVQKLTQGVRFIRVPAPTAPTQFIPPLYLKSGPLLRYTGIRKESAASGANQSNGRPQREIWRGSVMIVTADANSDYKSPPRLRLFAQPLDLLPPPPTQLDGEIGELAPEYVDPIVGLPKIGRDGKTLYVRPVEQLAEDKDLSKDESDSGLFESQRHVPPITSSPNAVDGGGDTKDYFAGRSQRGGVDGYKLGKSIVVKAFKLHAEQGVTFWRFNIEIELRDRQQRIAYRINHGPATGFWVPAQGQPMNTMFHSCNGFSLSVNADQFSGPDPMWRDVLNTHQTQPFHVMLGGGDQIYNDAVTQGAALFSEWLTIRNPHHKHNAPFTKQMQAELEKFYLDRYALWFSQGIFGLVNSQIPMVNIFDDHDIIDGFGSYPHHFMNSPVFSGLGEIAFKYYLLFQHQSIIDEGEETEPSWLLGVHPGPYIKQLSRSVFMSLGGGVAFLGLDCRTERTREDVVNDDTYAKVFDRLHDEIVLGETKHLIVLLGIPIAYPRLVWLENILTSRLMTPVKAAGKMGLFGKLLNQFDGGVEILDDLDDHWTAKHHKEERNWFVEELQDLAAEKSVRVTILGGDVHLAAIGQFFSNPKLGIPKDKDHRYMPNIISSAIVNTPPPEMMADVLNKRNKIHHLNDDTDENMIPIFTHDVTGAKRNNKRLMPRRNWCSIRAYDPELTPPPSPIEERSPSPPPRDSLFRRLSKRQGPSYRPDAGPPPSRGLMRTLSLQRGRPSTDSERPGMRQRSLSWSNELKPGNIFRRFSRRQRQDDNANGYGSETEEKESPFNGPSPPGGLRMRGGAGDDSYFPSGATASRAAPFSRTRVSRKDVLQDADKTFYRPASHAKAPPHRDEGYTSYDDTPDEQHFPPSSKERRDPRDLQKTEPAVVRRPFHRTPTGMSEKQRRLAGPGHEVNLEGGLDICLNVEVSQKDPAGITMPYRLLVPALFYEDKEEDYNHARNTKPSGLSRLMSFRRGPGGRKGSVESFESKRGEQGEVGDNRDEDFDHTKQRAPSGLSRLLSFGRGKGGRRRSVESFDDGREERREDRKQQEYEGRRLVGRNNEIDNQGGYAARR